MKVPDSLISKEKSVICRNEHNELIQNTPTVNNTHLLEDVCAISIYISLPLTLLQAVHLHRQEISTRMKFFFCKHLVRCINTLSFSISLCYSNERVYNCFYEARILSKCKL
jgi:hypothetical protein